MRTILIAPDIKALITDENHPFGPDSSCRLCGTASDGESGLQLADQVKPAIVVLDLQVPGLDGMDVLYRIRRDHPAAKILILTDNVEFSVIQRAISIGIDGCLKKPVAREDFLASIGLVQIKVKKTRELLRQYTLNDTLMDGMTGKLNITEEVQEILRENYGFVIGRPICTMMLYLGDLFEENHEQVKKTLEEAGNQKKHPYSSHIMEIESRKMILLVLFAMEDLEDVRRYFEETVVPILAREVCPGIICGWRKIQNLFHMHTMLEELENQLDWNLMFENGVLITYEKISNLRVAPFNYPKDLENQAKRALVNRQPMVFGECVRAFSSRCRNQLHRPKEIKEACIRFCIEIMKAARNYDFEPETDDLNIFQTIANAVSWDEIDSGLEQMFRRLLNQHAKQNGSSNTMIQKAWRIIHEEYQTDLTLEELARRLYVSKEYLSVQFKKETGKTFRETIRNLRIDKARELLLQTKLKVSQISEIVGYSDTKYMSRVFREIVGVGPAEYRKIH